MDSYLAVEKNGRNEIVIERSRFITSVFYAEKEEVAREDLNQVRKEFSDATHNCYAYVTDFGKATKSSDDGEPSGTAGVPILEVLKNKKLVNTLVVVTRYFGGIKLGAGGLVRAYSKSASEGIEAQGIRRFILCDIFSVELSYDRLKLFNQAVAPLCHKLISTDYALSVKVTVAVEKSGYKPFIDGLKAVFYDVEPKKEGEEFF